VVKEKIKEVKVEFPMETVKYIEVEKVEEAV
jgi:hypothetical protein